MMTTKCSSSEIVSRVWRRCFFYAEVTQSSFRPLLSDKRGAPRQILGACLPNSTVQPTMAAISKHHVIFRDTICPSVNKYVLESRSAIALPDLPQIVQACGSYSGLSNDFSLDSY